MGLVSKAGLVCVVCLIAGLEGVLSLDENGDVTPKEIEENLKMFKADTSECETDDWSFWSECSSSCGNGVQKRTRKLKPPATVKECSWLELQQVRNCNAHSCTTKDLEKMREVGTWNTAYWVVGIGGGVALLIWLVVSRMPSKNY